MIVALLDAGADPTVRDEDGTTPLHWAAENTSNPAVIVALLNAGADPNARDEDGTTPLVSAILAILTANPAVIVALLDAGADPNARTDDGWTPLHWAARLTDNSAVVVALLDAGADPNARDEDGWTPWGYGAGERRSGWNRCVAVAERRTFSIARPGWRFSRAAGVPARRAAQTDSTKKWLIGLWMEASEG